MSQLSAVPVISHGSAWRGVTPEDDGRTVGRSAPPERDEGAWVWARSLSPDRDDVRLGDDEDAVLRRRDDRRGTGERSKGGQHGAARREPKAGQALALKRRTGEHDAGMEVTGQGVALGRIRRLVAQNERGHEGRRVDTVD